MRPFLLLALLPLVCGCTPAPPPQAPQEPPPYVHRFEDAAAWARQFDDPSRDEWQRPARVVAAMRMEPGMTVADVGAGTGYFEPYLSRAVGDGGKVLALDVEPGMVEHLRARAARDGLGNVEARAVGADDPGLAAASVDRVLVVDTWHHVGHRAAYAARLRAALRPAGEVVVVDFNRASTRGPPPDHRIAPEEVVRELAAGGLDARIVEVDLPDQYVVIGRAR